MKSLITAGLLLSSTLAFAVTESKIYDVMYLPKAGTIFGSSELSYGMYQATLHDDTVGDVGDLERTQFKFEQTAGYSVTDSLFLTVGMNYALIDQDYDPEGAASESSSSDGESDPTIKARFRLVDDTAYQFDIIAGATVATGDKKISSEDKDGNNKIGGHTADLGIQYGVKTADLQWATSFIYTRHFEATQKDLGVKNDIDAFNSLALKVDILNHLFEKAYLRSFAALAFDSSYRDDNDTKTVQATHITLGSEFQYALTADLLLRAGVTYLNSENVEVGGIEAREDFFLTFLAGANYQF